MSGGGGGGSGQYTMYDTKGLDELDSRFAEHDLRRLVRGTMKSELEMQWTGTPDGEKAGLPTPPLRPVLADFLLAMVLQLLSSLWIKAIVTALITALVVKIHWENDRGFKAPLSDNDRVAVFTVAVVFVSLAVHDIGPLFDSYIVPLFLFVAEWGTLVLLALCVMDGKELIINNRERSPPTPLEWCFLCGSISILCFGWFVAGLVLLAAYWIFVIRHQYQTYRPQRGTIALWIFVIILAWMYVRSLSRAVAYNVELQAYDESLAMVTIDEPPFLKPEPAYQAVVFLSRYIGLDDLAAYNEAIGFVTTLRAMLAEEGVGLVLGLTDLAACRMPTAQGCLRTFSRAMDAGKDEVRSACLTCASPAARVRSCFVVSGHLSVRQPFTRHDPVRCCAGHGYICCWISLLVRWYCSMPPVTSQPTPPAMLRSSLPWAWTAQLQKWRQTVGSFLNRTALFAC